MMVKQIMITGLRSSTLMMNALSNNWNQCNSSQSKLSQSTGNRLMVPVGKPFTIELESNPSTGYGWNVVGSTQNNVELQSTDYVPDKHKPLMVGSGGKEKFTFIAKASGETTIILEYRQPWMKDDAPNQTAVFNIAATQK